MKAILVIDMPSDCVKCNQFVFDCCHAMKREIEKECIAQIKKPSWCPLIPIPSEACKRLVEGLDAMEKMKSVEVRVVRRTE